MKLNEIEQRILYHGDDFGTTKLEPKWMYHENSNNQVGVGIYFSPDIDVARSYGKNIISVELTHEQANKIIDAHDTCADHMDLESMIKFMTLLHEADNEEMFYKISDYIMVTEPDDVDDYIIEDFANTILNNGQMLHHFQNEMCAVVGPNVFVSAWAKSFPHIIGLIEKGIDFISLLDTSIQVSKVE